MQVFNAPFRFTCYASNNYGTMAYTPGPFLMVISSHLFINTLTYCQVTGFRVKPGMTPLGPCHSCEPRIEARPGLDPGSGAGAGIQRAWRQRLSYYTYDTIFAKYNSKMQYRDRCLMPGRRPDAATSPVDGTFRERTCLI